MTAPTFSMENDLFQNTNQSCRFPPDFGDNLLVTAKEVVPMERADGAHSAGKDNVAPHNRKTISRTCAEHPGLAGG